jgi:signal transduction histidine kinase
MSLWQDLAKRTGASFGGGHLPQQLRDYADATFSLTWHRQGMCAGIALLTAFFLDGRVAGLFFVVLMICEAADLLNAKYVYRIGPGDIRHALAAYAIFIVITVVSSAAISGFVIWAALEQGVGDNFMPLFVLFAAALFAAMNNHQLGLLLVVRLTGYAGAFFFITVKDLVVVRPPLTSELWLQFFTVVFVMYWLVDCSLQFLRLYRRNLAQLEELKAEHEKTKAALEVKSQFVSIVSHELRTPLTSIKGLLDLISSEKLGPVPAQIMPLVEMAKTNSQRLSHLIDDLLDLQKIEAGEMRFRREMVSVPALIGKAIAENEAMAKSFGVTLRHEASEVAPLYVMADASRMMQVLSNMISNAAKFSFEGGEVVVGSAVEGDQIRIYVRDQGVGIPEGAREKVFERFTQLDSSDQRRAGGTGLGLSISREIVEAFGGSIDYESEEGAGSTFFVDLPAIAPRPAQMPVEAPEPLRKVANG